MQDIVDALPQGWVMCQNRHTPTLREKRAMLDPYEVGMERVREMMLSHNRLSEAQIMEIGCCSIDRKFIMVVRDGKNWTIVNLTSANVKAYKGHGYIIKGKKVIPLQNHKQGTLEQLMDNFECGGDVRIDRLDAEGLFCSFQGRRIRKCKQKGGVGFAEQSRMVKCKTEEYSRPWKRGERVHYRSENKKRAEAERKEQMALGIIRVARIGLIYKSQTKAMR